MYTITYITPDWQDSASHTTLPMTDTELLDALNSNWRARQRPKATWYTGTPGIPIRITKVDGNGMSLFHTLRLRKGTERVYLGYYPQRSLKNIVRLIKSGGQHRVVGVIEYVS